MEFDLTTYIKAAMQGVPLLFVVIGLVWFWGKLGAKGTIQLLSSMATGLVLGMLYMIAMVRPPSGDWWIIFVYVFGNLIYALGLGILAALLHEWAKDILTKAIAKYFTLVGK